MLGQKGAIGWPRTDQARFSYSTTEGAAGAGRDALTNERSRVLQEPEALGLAG